MAAEDPEVLGKAFLDELRAFRRHESEDLGPATDLLRWGAPGVDDETLWRAVLTIVDLADYGWWRH
ncbi:MAG: hypothetical protein JOZ37_15095 [Actinobacteria bacterium]|nr:hypothetical protein [Actinomycetota bacterium]MBV9935030.1 hypothetical protein [Actinomycetota bacterium]